MIPVRRFLCTAVSFAVLAPNANGQTAKRPYSFEDVVTLVQAGVTPGRIISRIKPACITFQLTSGNVARLRAEGADDLLLKDLRGVCYRRPAEEADESTVRRDVPPRIITKHDTARIVVVKHDTVRSVIVQHDTVRSVAEPIAYVDINLRVDRSLDLRGSQQCEYRYDYGAFVVHNRVPQSCWTNWQTWLGDARIESESAAMAGEGWYNWGIAFGRNAAGTDYYTYSISSQGQFSLQHYADGKWTTLIEWQSSSAIRNQTGATNRLAVEIRGPSLALFINGVKVATYSTSAPVQGKIGVGTFGSNGEATVRFDNIRALELK